MKKISFVNTTIKFISISLSLLIALSPKAMADTRFSDRNSRHSIVVDMRSNRIVYEKDSLTPTSMASLTKMMTLLLTFDDLKMKRVSMSDKVKIVPSDVNRDGTNMKLNDGDIVGLDVLLDSMMIISANDSALAIARHVGGDYKTFVKRMNEKAKVLGMTSTVFYNPNGLPMYGEKGGKKITYENTTCARDVMILSKFLYENYEKELTNITSKKRFVNTEKRIDEENTNPILPIVKGVDGLKTGFTDRAGYCLAYSSRVGKDSENDVDNRLIGVSMGAPSKEARKNAAHDTLEFINNKYKTKNIYKKGQILASKDVNGMINMDLSSDEDVSVIKREEEEFKQRVVYKRINILKDSDKPVAQMQLLDAWGNVATTIDLYPSVSLKNANFIERAYYSGLALLGDLVGSTKYDKPAYPIFTIINESN